MVLELTFFQKQHFTAMKASKQSLMLFFFVAVIEQIIADFEYRNTASDVTLCCRTSNAEGDGADEPEGEGG